MNVLSIPSGSLFYKRLPLMLGVISLILFFVVSGLLSYRNLEILNRGSQRVVETHRIILGLNDLLSMMKDMETGQRGFLITGDEEYLDPYNQAMSQIQNQFNQLALLLRPMPESVIAMEDINRRVNEKIEELQQTITLRRASGFDAARTLVQTDKGKETMDAIRQRVEEIEGHVQTIRMQRLQEMDKAYRASFISIIITALIGLLLAIAVAILIRRASLSRMRQEWLQTGEAGLARAVIGEQRVEQLGENILSFLAHYLDAKVAAFFMKEGIYYKRIATYGVAADAQIIEGFAIGEGLPGQVAKTHKPILLKEVQEDYLTIGSTLGRGRPRHLLIVPAVMDDDANAVIELGFFQPVTDITLELLERISDSIAMAVRSAQYRLNLQNLLEETQRQAEELQTQGEELRVNNEELEEQSRALKESQSRLEQQQAELEQTNSQLEEQAQLLEHQRDDLARSQGELELKARELEMTSQYKSDFLANMSHELRTPLNSCLILSKLLADNPKGNLSEEQVNYARTIQTAGNDLLTLINDILDLSKIEAGHVELVLESFPAKQMVTGLQQVFEPVATDRGLELEMQVAEQVPEMLETDRQRLEQVLKNLLSNALKFTETGKVSLHVSAPEKGKISFAVTDTGIGISAEQQQAIFEAFRQADGAISRKYGGTGLGLSISRELVRLLGGTITLQSEAGSGSTFTVTIPDVWQEEHTLQPVKDELKASPHTKLAETELNNGAKRIKQVSAQSKYVQDDRDILDGNSRIILVVEDDIPFARILYDLIHERQFKCLIATSAEEALNMAIQYTPSAIVLDVGLPDNSGLFVLDRLKRDVRTRHIPVHVISAGDHAQTAFSLGAVGYMLKPVKHEDLIETLNRLETRLAHRMRRVLIVEDDPIQQDSIARLLHSQEVKTSGVGSMAACLEELKTNDYDCMVLDLSLPDASGYELLEILSREDAYSFPPVIVYTGRELSADEEQQLRRYSKSIIIKGAKSPERLLDEVTLFLHQVVSDMPPEHQQMLELARNRDSMLEGKTILVMEDDIRNIYALTGILEPHGVKLLVARNGREGINMLEKHQDNIDLVLMDVMMPEMDGLTATREIRKRPEWKKLPIIMLTAKAMKDDQEKCLAAGANDYMAKPLDVEKLLSLVRVWMPR